MSHRVVSWLARVLVLAVLLWAPRAHAWIENHVTAADTHVALERDGHAVVEHRLTLRTNGSDRLRSYRLEGIDADAEPLSNAYVVPARDALSSSLESAVPLSLEVVQLGAGRDGAPRPPELSLKVDDPRGLRRGSYVFVFRYRTDLRGRQRIEADGAMVRITWHGPVLADGLSGPRATFVVPHAPTPPRAEGGATGHDGTLAPTFLTAVRRGGERDEIELMRTYAPEGEAVRWSIRVDPRALEPLPKQEAGPADGVVAKQPPRWQLGAGAGLFVLYLLLVWYKTREVTRLAGEARATMPPLVPLPVWLRAPLAAAALVAGVGLQLVGSSPSWGAIAVLLACALAAHGAARPDPASARRGPGRWLTVGEREVFARPPRARGALLDVSTRLGKALLLLLLGGAGAGAWWLSKTSLAQALLLSLDAVALLAIFGTGLITAMPPDLAVEPARFLRKLSGRLRKNKALSGVRIVPRIRIPHGEMDADELRLLVVPRMPLRGFTAIEIGLSYAVGLGARVAMPEVLLRVVAGSPCDEAMAAVSRSGRITPGRKPDERVIALSPRLPTVHMTSEIVAALAVRVMDREAARRAREAPAEPLAA